MNDPTSDFGTGLRAHLGLERAQLDLVAEPEPAPAARAELPSPPVDLSAAQALTALEDALHTRERELVLREASLAGRAGSLLAAAQALYDEVLGGGPSPQDDELAQLRSRKSVA